MTFKASGNVFYSSNAATFSNVTIGGGTLLVGPYSLGGSIAGYTSGGYTSSTARNIIDNFPFASDANATDVGDLSVTRATSSGQSSDTHGYTSGGYQIPYPGSGYFNTIDRFPFASGGNATDVGDLQFSAKDVAGQSSSTSGYITGGYVSNPTTTMSNSIQKFPFATNANASEIGFMTVRRMEISGQSSQSNGYTSGGRIFPGGSTTTKKVDRFPFATDGNATDVGDLAFFNYYASGQSSQTSGYVSGGSNSPNNSYSPSVITNTIQKFPFATNANATDVADLAAALLIVVGQSSTVSGYVSGGHGLPANNTIQKFPFASDTNGTDVGDLTLGRNRAAGQQD